MTYQNPIIPGFYPDPSVTYGKDAYYLVNSSFQYMPGIPLFQSQDLINWTQIGNILTSPSQIDLQEAVASGGIYAPTIRFYQGYFYMITTCLTKHKIQNFFMKTKDPSAGWSNPILLSFGGIDPSLYFEDDHVYAQYASADRQGVKCIKQVALDIETGELIGEEQILTYGSGGRDVEGPHLYARDGYYYLLCAEGGTREGHMITIHRSKRIWGPYVSHPDNPILTNRDRGDLLLQGIGHGDLIEDHSGQWWMVCLGYRSIKHTHVTGRETMLVPVQWEKDAWPSVQDGVLKEQYPSPQGQQLPLLDFHDHFDSNSWAPEWIALRDMTKLRYETGAGHLKLYASQTPLQEEGTPAFLAIRQQDIHCSWQTTISMRGMQYGEAGLAIYMDPAHCMQLGIQKTAHACYAFVRKQVKELQIMSEKREVTTSLLQLRIQADALRYTFYVNDEELDWTYCKHLSTEVSDAMFHGVVGGIYVVGTEEYATFHSFDYLHQDKREEDKQ